MHVLAALPFRALIPLTTLCQSITPQQGAQCGELWWTLRFIHANRRTHRVDNCCTLRLQNLVKLCLFALSSRNCTAMPLQLLRTGLQISAHVRPISVGQRLISCRFRSSTSRKVRLVSPERQSAKATCTTRTCRLPRKHRHLDLSWHDYVTSPR